MHVTEQRVRPARKGREEADLARIGARARARATRLALGVECGWRRATRARMSGRYGEIRGDTGRYGQTRARMSCASCTPPALVRVGLGLGLGLGLGEGRGAG